MSRRIGDQRGPEARFPRVSGDEPPGLNARKIGIWFSPREWG